MSPTPPILSFLEDRLYGRSTNRQKVFTSLTPTHTIPDIIKENVILSRFTDSGEILLAFTNCFQSVVAFAYLGIESIANSCDIKLNDEAFKRVFKKKFEVTPGRQLVGTIMLQSEDGKHLILLSEFAECTEIIYCLSLCEGNISDSYVINNGDVGYRNIHLYRDRLVILLKKSQEIRILRLSKGGKLSLEDSIGEFSCSSDMKLASMYRSENSIPALTHRLLVWWWHNAGPTPGEKLRNYYRQYNVILSLKMLSFQFLDRNNIIICYGLNFDEPSLFAFYNIESSEILAIFDDDDTAKVLSQNLVNFVLPTLTAAQASQISRNTMASYQTFIDNHLPHQASVMKGRCGKFLPFICQSQLISPYLNTEHFEWSFDRIKPFVMCRCLKAGCDLDDDIVFLTRQNSSRFLLEDTARADVIIFHPKDPMMISGTLLQYVTDIPHYRYHLHYHSPD